MKGDESKEQIKSREDVLHMAFNSMCLALAKLGHGNQEVAVIKL